jgi:hypothetical protein
LRDVTGDIRRQRLREGRLARHFGTARHVSVSSVRGNLEL